jgi:hypothetical protein
MDILGFNIALKCNAVQTYRINPLYRLLLHNMDISIYPKDVQTQFLVTVLIVGTIYLVSISISVGVSSASNEQLEYNITTGKINSTLKNEEENKMWLLSGSWKSNLFINTKFNHTNPAKFSAKINMVMANGSLPHKHKISHFILTNISTVDNSAEYEGYAAVSMKLGPVFAIPVIIKNYHNETISISFESLHDITLDQKNVISHFGGKPILGIFYR